MKERHIPIVLPEIASVEKVIARAPGLLADMIKAAWVSGARQEELAGGRHAQLELESRRLTIVKGKGDKTRVIDLNPFDGFKVFERLPKGVGQAYLFWHTDGRRYRDVSIQFHKLVKKIYEDELLKLFPDMKLEDAVAASEATEQYPQFRRFRFHDLRHLHAVEWLRSGRSIYDLQKRLGHSSIKTTERYLAFLTSEEERIVKRGSSEK